MRFNRTVLQSFLEQGRPIGEARDRIVGRSTILALRNIAAAIEGAGEWVPVKDHWDTTMSHRHLLTMTSNMVDMLGLQGFEFNVHYANNPDGGRKPWPAVRCTFAEAV